jgi:hypothetical protein
MDRLKAILTAGALTTIASTSASAVTIDFGLQNTGPTSSISMTQSGISLTISARTIDEDSSDLDTASVVQYNDPSTNSGGLGVISQPTDSNQMIDGGNNNLNDLLLLTFSSAVRITGIAFAGVDTHPTGGPDIANFTIDGSSAGNAAIDTSGFPAFLAVNWVGTTFGISALGTTDEFLIRAIQVTPVPVPAAGILFASGIAGIAALSRKKKQLKT